MFSFDFPRVLPSCDQIGVYVSFSSWQHIIMSGFVNDICKIKGISSLGGENRKKESSRIDQKASVWSLLIRIKDICYSVAVTLGWVSDTPWLIDIITSHRQVIPVCGAAQRASLSCWRTTRTTISSSSRTGSSTSKDSSRNGGWKRLRRVRSGGGSIIVNLLVCESNETCWPAVGIPEGQRGPERGVAPLPPTPPPTTSRALLVHTTPRPVEARAQHTQLPRLDQSFIQWSTSLHHRHAATLLQCSPNRQPGSPSRPGFARVGPAGSLLRDVNSARIRSSACWTGPAHGVLRPIAKPWFVRSQV